MIGVRRRHARRLLARRTAEWTGRPGAEADDGGTVDSSPDCRGRSSTTTRSGGDLRLASALVLSFFVLYVSNVREIGGSWDTTAHYYLSANVLQHGSLWVDKAHYPGLFDQPRYFWLPVAAPPRRSTGEGGRSDRSSRRRGGSSGGTDSRQLVANTFGVGTALAALPFVAVARWIDGHAFLQSNCLSLFLAGRVAAAA